MRPVAPVDGALIHQAHESLMNQRRALNRVIRALPAQVPRGQSAQLVVQQRGELPEGRFAPPAPLKEQPRDWTIGFHVCQILTVFAVPERFGTWRRAPGRLRL